MPWPLRPSSSGSASIRSVTPLSSAEVAAAPWAVPAAVPWAAGAEPSAGL